MELCDSCDEDDEFCDSTGYSDTESGMSSRIPLSVHEYIATHIIIYMYT